MIELGAFIGISLWGFASGWYAHEARHRMGRETRAMREVYLEVRAVGHGRLRSLRCVLDVRSGSWQARDAGEMLAQTRLLASRLSSGPGTDDE